MPNDENGTSEGRTRLTVYVPDDMLAELNQRLFHAIGTTYGRNGLIVKAIRFYLDSTKTETT